MITEIELEIEMLELEQFSMMWSFTPTFHGLSNQFLKVKSYYRLEKSFQGLKFLNEKG